MVKDRLSRLAERIATTRRHGLVRLSPFLALVLAAVADVD
ncbi:hypothetical protein USDA257_p00250 (plasmid) [Sinorhizobium fredii USDA 257]|uniref:Uncharacterized protein n=1 Tax=Sinorhizobium fredii (strain USDA 257) TaxID=1185652 RepID=I3XFT8_SINF2|nr:hypothetical protein USDA257_p00250 [Sinorhizobium fredii USDA 257]